MLAAKRPLMSAERLKMLAAKLPQRCSKRLAREVRDATCGLPGSRPQRSYREANIIDEANVSKYKPCRRSKFHRRKPSYRSAGRMDDQPGYW
jgi:hypothetical protein